MANLAKKLGKILTYAYAGPHMTALSQLVPSGDRVKALLGTGAAAGSAMALGVSGAVQAPPTLAALLGGKGNPSPIDPGFIGPPTQGQALVQALQQQSDPSFGLLPQVKLPSLNNLLKDNHENLIQLALEGRY